jgi:hypothetical protein
MAGLREEDEKELLEERKGRAAGDRGRRRREGGSREVEG